MLLGEGDPAPTHAPLELLVALDQPVLGLSTPVDAALEDLVSKGKVAALLGNQSPSQVEEGKVSTNASLVQEVKQLAGIRKNIRL